MYSIGVLAKEFGLSRSTLLYYDSISLLVPSSRTKSGYRDYSEEDKNLLEKICEYRGMGISLEDIKKINNLSENRIVNVLENQLHNLSEKIQELKKQQHAILEVIQNETTTKPKSVIDKYDWVSILRASGMTDNDMDNWHKEFERLSPTAHYEFLISLGISDKNAKKIQKRSL